MVFVFLLAISLRSTPDSARASAAAEEPGWEEAFLSRSPVGSEWAPVPVERPRSISAGRKVSRVRMKGEGSREKGKSGLCSAGHVKLGKRFDCTKTTAG